MWPDWLLNCQLLAAMPAQLPSTTLLPPETTAHSLLRVF
jgi:hypothetical protein